MGYTMKNACSLRLTIGYGHEVRLACCERDGTYDCVYVNSYYVILWYRLILTG